MRVVRMNEFSVAFPCRRGRCALSHSPTHLHWHAHFPPSLAQSASPVSPHVHDTLCAHARYTRVPALLLLLSLLLRLLVLVLLIACKVLVLLIACKVLVLLIACKVLVLLIACKVLRRRVSPYLLSPASPVTLAIVCEKARGCDDAVIVQASHSLAAYRAAILTTFC
jgi:hypothetical protein